MCLQEQISTVLCVGRKLAGIRRRVESLSFRAMIGADGVAEMGIALLPHPRGCSDEKGRSNAASVDLAGMRKAKSVEKRLLGGS
jgi:hypothetical protein